MKPMIRTLALLLSLFLLLSFSACSTVGNPTESESSSTADLPDPDLNIRVMVLNGTTGFGMAKLMNDRRNGKAALGYTFSTEAAGETVIKALINGSVDIAALPTNAAAKVYNKTNGAVQILALNTLGVLYVVTAEGAGVTDFHSLIGKTVYCPADNPSIIFKAICTAAGLEIGKDIFIDTTYAEPAKLRSAVAAGEVDIAVLPEPMVTIALNANPALSVRIDLTEEWNNRFTVGSLAQGCVVVRKEFADAHPLEIRTFLEEYAASIEFMQKNVAEAATLIVEEGIFAGNSPIVEAAIPKCNVTFKSGEDMKNALKVFYETLFSVDPTSVGGAIPQDSFYYGCVTEGDTMAR